MKYIGKTVLGYAEKSLPTRGAWIEIDCLFVEHTQFDMSLPIRGAWIESILVGLAGILEAARTGGANSAYGFSYEFDAISACVVGRVSLSGGVGKVSGAVLGVIIFTIISYGLAFIGINPNWQLIVKGIIICTAVALDMRKNSK